MRGTVSLSEPVTARQRFIPAHAGNSDCGVVTGIPTSVHPRACGEQRYSRLGRIDSGGSSPRMRGTGAGQGAGGFGDRFIPAHAGNRAGSRWGRWGRPVHPRACGEQADIGDIEHCAAGSSPRMRGTATAWSASLRAGRFIPAHAGNSSVMSIRISTAPVHPRACGEQVTTAVRLNATSGSSPRMRGTGTRPQSRQLRIRFIPAHAGNRWPYTGECPKNSVHPRACGEQPTS